MCVCGLRYLEEGLCGEERVGARLVHGPHPLHLELLGDLLKAAVKVLTRSDQVLTHTQTGSQPWALDRDGRVGCLWSSQEGCRLVEMRGVCVCTLMS